MTLYRLEIELLATDTNTRRRILHRPHVFTGPDNGLDRNSTLGGHSTFNVTTAALGTYTKNFDGLSHFLLIFSDLPINVTVTDNQVSPVSETLSRIRLLHLEKELTQISIYNPSSTTAAQITVVYEFTPIT
jgi:hypothetical protein